MDSSITPMVFLMEKISNLKNINPHSQAPLYPSLKSKFLKVGETFPVVKATVIKVIVPPKTQPQQDLIKFRC